MVCLWKISAMTNERTQQHAMIDENQPQPLIKAVLHCPDTSINCSGFHANQSLNSVDDPVEGVLLRSFTNNATHLVQNVLRQLHLHIQENQEMKKSIRLNNEELQKKFRELLEWKNNMKIEKAKLKNHYEKSHNAVVRLQSEIFALRNENALMAATNQKLEFRLHELARVVKTRDDGELKDDAEENARKLLHSKYLNTLETLESRLQESLSLRETLEAKCKHFLDVNRKLQQNVVLCQRELVQFESLKREKEELDTSYKATVKELNATKEKFADAEKQNEDMQSQLLQLIRDNEVYQKESEKLKSTKQSLQKETTELRALSSHVQDSLQRSRQEVESLQFTIHNLEKKVKEKTHGLDNLFREYDRLRVENQRLNAERPDIDNLYARLIGAEEFLQRKDRDKKDFQDRLRVKDEDIRKLQEDISFFKAQADVYKQDFLIEREDRQKLNEQLEQLKSSMQQQYNVARYDTVRR